MSVTVPAKLLKTPGVIQEQLLDEVDPSALSANASGGIEISDVIDFIIVVKQVYGEAELQALKQLDANLIDPGNVDVLRLVEVV